VTFNTILVIGTVIIIAGYIPQVWKTWRTKSAGDLSLRAWMMWLVGESCVLVYAIGLYIHYPKSFMLLIFSSLSFALIGISTILVILYKTKGSKKYLS